MNLYTLGPSLPNALWVGIWTPKHLLESWRGSKRLLRRYLEDFGRLGIYHLTWSKIQTTRKSLDPNLLARTAVRPSKGATRPARPTAIPPVQVWDGRMDQHLANFCDIARILLGHLWSVSPCPLSLGQVWIQGRPSGLNPHVCGR